MVAHVHKRNILLILLAFTGMTGISQTVPGINYQAVARDNFGKELINREIDVMFSIISGNPLGTLVYREVHAKVRTSNYGVFSLVIGKGEPTSIGSGLLANFSQISWETANHYLKVEVKFNSDFLDMGTMQFFAVPYALYAKKSLEPGPQGLKGDKGDPATDDQTLSFNGNNLSIAGGNTVNLSTLNVAHNLSLLGDTLSIYGGNSVKLPNHLQDLSLDPNNKIKLTKSASEIDLTPFKQNLSYNNSTGFLSISNGTGADLTVLKTDEIQDIKLTGNQLTIDKNAASTGVDLGKYLDNKDEQTLVYNPSTYNLSITGGNSVTIGATIGFKAKKSSTQTGLTAGTTYPFVNSDAEFIESSCYEIGSGSFTAPIQGIYTFYITYKADGPGSARVLSLLKNGTVYEILGPDISSGTEIIKWVTMKLDQGNVISLTINTGTSTYSGTGSFLGYKAN
jgi:hypothetical protein